MRPIYAMLLTLTVSCVDDEPRTGVAFADYADAMFRADAAACACSGGDCGPGGVTPTELVCLADAGDAYPEWYDLFVCLGDASADRLECIRRLECDPDGLRLCDAAFNAEGAACRALDPCVVEATGCDRWTEMVAAFESCL